jgi:hypothetical protein
MKQLKFITLSIIILLISSCCNCGGELIDRKYEKCIITELGSHAKHSYIKFKIINNNVEVYKSIRYPDFKVCIGQNVELLIYTYKNDKNEYEYRTDDKEVYLKLLN